jgi:hypothetical protein
MQITGRIEMIVDRTKKHRRTHILSSGAGALLSMFVTFIGFLPQPVRAAAPYGFELTIERNEHTATVLQGGKVLIVGGKSATGTALNSAEIVDAMNPSSTQPSVPGLQTPRTGHTATSLANGDVLVAGGNDGSAALNSTQIFDHSTNAWSAETGDLQHARSGHTATLLDNDHILIAGGDASGSAEIYGSAASVGPLNTPRSKHGAVRLNDGKVLIVGGIDNNGNALTTAELFDPSTSTFTPVATQLALPRVKPDLRLLPDGKVQVIGGASDGSFEMYDPNESNAKPGFNAKVEALNPTTTLDDVLNAQTRGSILFDGSVVPGGPLSDILNRNGYATTEIAQPAVNGAPQASKVLISGGVSSTVETTHHSAYVVDGSPATITTNATDYAPGTDVYVDAKGWKPGEKVDFMLHKVKADGVVVDWTEPVSWTTDLNGELNGYAIYQPIAPDDIDAKFTLTAVGQESGFVAQTGFTDQKPDTVSVGTQSPNPITAGNSVTYIVTVAFNGNSTSCTTGLTISGLPGGASLGSFNPSSVTHAGSNGSETSTLTINTTAGLSPATYPFTVKATPASDTCQSGAALQSGSGSLIVGGATNSPPVITSGDSTTVNMSEDGSPTAFNLTLNATDANTSDTLTWSVSSAASHGTANASGTGLSKAIGYTPNVNYNGTDSFVVQVSDGTTTDTITVNVNIAAVNDTPSFAVGGNVTVNEDSGAYSAAQATSISDGDPEVTQTLTFNASNDNNGLFSTQPSIAADGTLTFTPAANANGSATVTVTLTDDATAGGAAITTASQTFTITVTAVNDTPSFAVGGNVTVNEDSGAYSAAQATSISDGDPEVTQTLTFNASNDNNGLFSTQPSIAADGTLTFTPAANANGSATVTVTLTDDATAGGAAITTASQTFIITVTAVNDAPSFTKGADQTILVNAGAQTVNSWATNLSAGPANESGQALDFIVTNNNAALFSVQPSISSDGTLTYTPALNAAGTVTVYVKIHDDGGTANGGVNTSTSQTFTITVQYSTGACLGSPGHQILQPIDFDGSSVFKQKSTVPAKFRVCDAIGNSIGTPGVVSSFKLIQIITGTFVDTVDEAVVSTTPDTAFRWSATDQQWIFNMNTKSQSSSKTYVYLITLNDGSTIQFQYGLK